MRKPDKSSKKKHKKSKKIKKDKRHKHSSSSTRESTKPKPEPKPKPQRKPTKPKPPNPPGKRPKLAQRQKQQDRDLLCSQQSSDTPKPSTQVEPIEDPHYLPDLIPPHLQYQDLPTPEKEPPRDIFQYFQQLDLFTRKDVAPLQRTHSYYDKRPITHPLTLKAYREMKACEPISLH